MAIDEHKLYQEFWKAAAAITTPSVVVREVDYMTALHAETAAQFKLRPRRDNGTTATRAAAELLLQWYRDGLELGPANLTWATLPTWVASHCVSYLWAVSLRHAHQGWVEP
jgi:hypothetical protein